MFAASAEHSCIRPLFCSEIAQCVDSFGELRVSWWTLRTSKTNNPIATVYSSLLFKGCKSFGNIYAN